MSPASQTSSGAVPSSDSAAEQTAMADPATDAAVQIAEAALALANGLADLNATLVGRGADPLWHEVRVHLEAAGFIVTHHVLADDDQQWNPPIDVTGVLIHHDPFHAASSLPGGCDRIRALLAREVRLVFVDFPHGLRDAQLRQALRKVYIGALSTSREAMQTWAGHLIAALDKASAVEIVDTDTDTLVLRAEPPWQVRSDWTSAHLDHPILQLPFGEVWLACVPTHIANQLLASGHRPVEIGIGINVRALRIEQATLAEKAFGALHLGYGDNELLGGEVRAGWHTDRMLPPRMRLWMEGQDGRRVSLDSVLT